jgi:hypothetical protein
MQIPASFAALAALVALALPSHAVAGGTVQVTSGNVVVARPVGPQPPVMLRPGLAQPPLVVAPAFAVTQPLLVTQQPVVVTRPIIIGQPFVITQRGIIQQQILVPGNGVFFTSQGAMLVIR